MDKNFKTKLLTSISAITLLAVAHAHEAHAQVIDYNSFDRSMSSIYSTMNIMGSWNNVRTTSLQGISGKNIRKLRGLQDQVAAVEKQWQSQNNSLNNLSAQEKLAVYNSQSYQDAYAQYLYMTKYVKPLTVKLISGSHLTVTEAKQYADPFAITAIRNTEKATTVAQFINQQTLILGVTTTPVTSTTVTIAPTVRTATINGAEYTEPASTYSDGAATQTVQKGTAVSSQTYSDSYKDVDNGNGSITRTTTRITTTTTTTPQTTITTVTRNWTDKVYRNVTTTTTTTPQTQTTYSDGRVVITAGTPVISSNTVKTFVRDSVRTAVVETDRKTENLVTATTNAPGVVINTQVMSKTVSDTAQLAPNIETAKQPGSQYTTTTYVDSAVQSASKDGTPIKNSSTTDNMQVIKNADGSTTTNTYRITTTTTTTPRTYTESYVRTYTDTVKQDVVTVTRTTPVTKITYTDGTSITQNGTTTESRSTDTIIISTSTRTETINNASRTENIVSTESNAPGVLYASTTTAPVAEAPVDNTIAKDPNMGTPTPVASNDPNFHKTSEFMRNNANTQIKADQAYARGWTGKGVTVAIADTGYLTTHQDLQGQVIATKDYTGTGVNDTHGHGTHTLGTIVGLKNDVGTHGVAYDAKAIVIKIGSTSSVNTNNGALGLAWAADNGATVGNISANSNYDRTFRNNLLGISDGTYLSKDTRYNYGAGQYYNMQDPNLWKSVTDKGMVVVNSAGNQGLAVSANPGYFATVTDSNGNLLLGGRMLIVGAVDENNKFYSWSNRAGHICQQFNSSTNTCSDKYRVSDFYILAPGGTNSTNRAGDVGYMEGTSMAAPVVTGGVAIINQMWPYMKGENIVKLLTTTANKSIPDYNKETHGAGVLDLDRATQPVGSVGIPTGGRTTSAAKTTSISNTGGSGSALSSLASTGSLSNVMVVDEFSRDFYVNLSNGITVKDKRKISEVNVQQSGTSYLPFQQSLGTFEQGGEWTITDDLKFGFANSKDVKGDYTSHVSKNFKMDDKFRIRTTMGTIGEKHTWLGNDSSGALAVGKNNKTYFSQIGFDYVEARETWSIDLGRGYTTVNTTDESMIKKVNTLQSQSLKLGYERNINDNQKWGITVGVPNYINKGSATVSVPYATTAEGNIVYDNVKANLKTRTPERNLGLYYTESGETDLDWNVRLSTEYRHNLAGEAGKKGVGFGIQVEKKFWGSCGFGPWLNMKEFCVKMREDEENFKKEYAKKSQVYEDMLSGKNTEAIGWNK
jgi:subtilisin family serine protease